LKEAEVTNLLTQHINITVTVFAQVKWLRTLTLDCSDIGLDGFASYMKPSLVSCTKDDFKVTYA
jgi:hypothetical protein